ncbi:imelysin family protein [Gynuella sunshinyii]|uniref:Putative iron-regulated protein n=1 Tax=Gynuella sunshinyii YC6258 TaxID=1445510 RepID=A0A0C5VWU1_9GAMM|nr:imelysin family protein [Gynuella sunshinyii]AJQ97738.1 putative iron-regulated protein [Gynuella sunshinyii YC6258]
MNSKTTLTIIVGLVILNGCDRPEPTQAEIAATESPAFQPIAEADPTPLVKYWYHRAESCLDIALSSARELQSNVETFLLEPTQSRLDLARTSWRAAHGNYISCTLYSTQATSPQRQAFLDKITSTIDAWPIQPGFIDYLPDYPQTGLINDTTLQLTQERLIQEHQFSSLEDVSLGFHALEFMLWGNNNNRPAEDFVAIASHKAENGIEIEPQNRRRNYTTLLTHHLTGQLKLLTDAWNIDNEGDALSLKNMPASAQLNYLLSALYNTLKQQVLAGYLTPAAENDMEAGNEAPFSSSTHEALVSILLELNAMVVMEPQGEHQNLAQFIDIRHPESALKLIQALSELTTSLDQLPADYLQNLEANTAKIEAVKQKINTTLTMIQEIAGQYDQTLTLL